MPSSPGSVALEFDISTAFPLVTLVTMVAPSPDWFVGVSGLSLVENGAWVQTKSVDLVPWDAGTDSGASYGSADRATAPPTGIQLLAGAPVENGGRVAPMGRFVFRRLS